MKASELKQKFEKRARVLPRVHSSQSNKCPLCKKVMKPTEGSSETWDGEVVVIQCGYCGGEYHYDKTKEK